MLRFVQAFNIIVYIDLNMYSHSFESKCFMKTIKKSMLWSRVVCSKSLYRNYRTEQNRNFKLQLFSRKACNYQKLIVIVMPPVQPLEITQYMTSAVNRERKVANITNKQNTSHELIQGW